jgi:hypothetical protein
MSPNTMPIQLHTPSIIATENKKALYCTATMNAMKITV